MREKVNTTGLRYCLKSSTNIFCTISGREDVGMRENKYFKITSGGHCCVEVLRRYLKSAIKTFKALALLQIFKVLEAFANL